MNDRTQSNATNGLKETGAGTTPAPQAYPSRHISRAIQRLDDADTGDIQPALRDLIRNDLQEARKELRADSGSDSEAVAVEVGD